MKLDKGARLVGMSILPGSEAGPSSTPADLDSRVLDVIEGEGDSAEDGSEDEDASDDESGEEMGVAEEAVPIEAQGPWLLLVTSKV